jgi:hypothetical protein
MERVFGNGMTRGKTGKELEGATEYEPNVAFAGI